MDELLAGTLTQIRLKKEHIALQVSTNRKRKKNFKKKIAHQLPCVCEYFERKRVGQMKTGGMIISFNMI